MRILTGFGSPAFAFVFTMGIVNLFGDVTYEGGASINGPFMAVLGASALTVSVRRAPANFSVTRCVLLPAMLPTRAAATG